MSVAFANVTDIKIPEGDVTKITETATGRVLWEKNIYPDINLSWMRVSSRIGPISRSGIPKIKKIVPSTYWIRSSYSSNQCSKAVMACLHLDNVDEYNTNRLNSVFTVTPEAVDGIHCGVHAVQSFADSGLDLRGATVLGVSPIISINGSSTMFSSTSKGFLILKDTKSKKYGLHTYDELQNMTPLIGHSDIHYVMNDATPSTNGKVWVTYCPLYDEFLVTGLSGKLCIVKGTNYTMTCYDSDLVRTTWVDELKMYFGTKGATISYSSNGISWTNVQVFSSGTIKGVAWLSAKKKLCAINTQGQIAISSDGKTWEVKTTPFKNVLAFAYSPDIDVLCAVISKKAYVTRDLIDWHEISTPNNDSVIFHDILHIGHGVFIGYEYDGTKAYILSTAYSMLNVSNSSYMGLIQV